MNLNVWTGIGRLVVKPTYRKRTKTSDHCATLRLAVNRVVGSANGDPRCDYFFCSFWGDLAIKLFKQKADKGDEIWVRGQIRTNQSRSASGGMNSYVEVRVDGFNLIHKSMRNLSRSDEEDETTLKISKLTRSFKGEEP